MGYAQTLPLSFLEYGNTHQLNYFDIGTVPSTPTWNSISSTYLRTAGHVNESYLDAYFPCVKNTAVGANRLTTLHNIQVSRTDVVGWNNAIPMGLQTMYVPIGETIDFGRAVGNINISAVVNACIENNTALQFRWVDADADANSLRIYNSYLVLRCMR